MCVSERRCVAADVADRSEGASGKDGQGSCAHGAHILGREAEKLIYKKILGNDRCCVE